MSKKEKRPSRSSLELGGLNWYCLDYFKIPLSKAISYDKKLKKVYNSFRKRFLAKAHTEETYIYLLKQKENDIFYYRLIWATNNVSYVTRDDILDLDSWMKEMSQLSSQGEPKIAMISTEPGRDKIILELPYFDYRLADRIKSQAILDVI